MYNDKNKWESHSDFRQSLGSALVLPFFWGKAMIYSTPSSFPIARPSPHKKKKKL